MDSAYRTQDDILYGGVSWTLKRGAWLANTELRLFGLGYRDDRPVDKGGKPDEVEVYTLGGSWLGVYPLGPGRADLLLWIAGQTGDFDDLDHQAVAAVAEFGYRLADVAMEPWLRLGVNFASGDGDPDDSDHETFFNVLPTNHLYYGFADQLAFQNLVDWFVQLKLSPLPGLALDLFLHRFSLASDDDASYAGTGAYNERVFGYVEQPSRGLQHVGTEVDVVARYAVHRHVSVEAGYAFLDGGALLREVAPGRDADVHFGYVQISAHY